MAYILFFKFPDMTKYKENGVKANGKTQEDEENENKNKKKEKPKTVSVGQVVNYQGSGGVCL